MFPNTNKSIKVSAYKYDGTLYRQWSRIRTIYSDKRMIICACNHSLVVEENGKHWWTKKPTLLFFYKNNFFNVIVTIKNSNFQYYCNIATPYVFEDNTIKYIDLDLDYKVLTNNSGKLLDSKEYIINSKKYGYSDKLQEIIEHELSTLKKLHKDAQGPFNKKTINYWYNYYKGLIT